MAKSIYEFSYTSRKAVQRKIRIVLLFIAVIYLLVTLCMQFVIMPVKIKSDAMEPCLRDNDRAFVSKISAHDSLFFSQETVYRGKILYVKPHGPEKSSFVKRAADTVAAFFTFGILYPFENAAGDSPVLRRVVGLPGDTLYIRDYVVYVKPAGQNHFLTEFELSGRQYDIFISDKPEIWDKTVGAPGVLAETVLGDDEIFVLSDNRSVGVDSRIWGALPLQSIRGSAVLRYFPFTGFKLL